MCLAFCAGKGYLSDTGAVSKFCGKQSRQCRVLQYFLNIALRHRFCHQLFLLLVYFTFLHPHPIAAAAVLLYR